MIHIDPVTCVYQCDVCGTKLRGDATDDARTSFILKHGQCSGKAGQS